VGQLLTDERFEVRPHPFVHPFEPKRPAVPIASLRRPNHAGIREQRKVAELHVHPDALASLARNGYGHGHSVGAQVEPNSPNLASAGLDDRVAVPSDTRQPSAIVDDAH
jgi:hypothetical protein